MVDLKLLDLQLFGEGSGGDGNAAGSGADGSTATGVNPADAGRARLLELGVPASKIRKNRSYNVASGNAKPDMGTQTPPVSAAQTGTEPHADDVDEGKPTEANDTPPAKLSWEELMKDPDYNREMQKTVQARVSKAKEAEDQLSKLAPMLSLIARKYGLDGDSIDYDALAKKVEADDSYYEDKALEMGVSTEVARKIDNAERIEAKYRADQQRTLEQQRFAQHFQSLEQQAAELKAEFPTFDLRTELNNPVFARLTAPGGGVSVKDAYFAVHRQEIQSAAMRVATQRTAQQISNAIQAGQSRPDENGTSSTAASVTSFDYKNASRQQREDLKARIRMAAARGEKIYPGMK